MIINKSVVTLSNETLAKYAKAEPATIGHFRQFGFNTVSLQVSVPGRISIGRAVTLRIPSMDSVLCHKVAELMGPGDILMIDRAGDQQYACLGGGVAYSLKVKNVEAVILDGAATDIGEIQEMDLVVYYRRLSAITTRLLGTDGEINTTVNCCGATVNPGDIVVADQNGFVVLPPSEAEGELQRALEYQEGEKTLFTRLKAGDPMSEIFQAGELIRKAMSK
ncbi:4-hydroxy-4-methyl-2-oxoglutarate aldolase [Synergistales bacterium]|nr:4-hydroxy-4-methyl-2-oxoglutarate aldolase [Synergistales bacterium]